MSKNTSENLSIHTTNKKSNEMALKLTASTLLLFFVIATLVCGTSAVLACKSTSQDYRVRTLTVNVQPTLPVLVQRYQAPELRIFCFSAQLVAGTSGVSSADCTAAAASAAITALKICRRNVNEPDGTSLCDDFSGISSETVFGSINGPEMVWDVLWVGSALPPQCFPRGVQFSYLALVRGSSVSSVGLFVVLLIIAILALILGVLSMGYFVKHRVELFDAAGAVSIAGPKGTFAGAQMQVRTGAAEDAQANYDDRVPTMYLPVRHGADGSPLYGAEGAELTAEQLAEMQAQNALHNGGQDDRAVASRMPRAIAMKGASPPRPGDGIEGFEGAARAIELSGEGGGALGAFDGIGAGKYRDGPPGSLRRRRGYRPHHGGSSPGGDDDDGFGGGGGGTGRRRNKALFPTHYDFETNDGITNQGDAPFGAGAPRDRFDRDSSGAYVDENGIAYSRDGQRLVGGLQGVRYVPQWMHAFHGRDDNADGVQDTMADAFDGGAPANGLNDSNSGGPFTEQGRSAGGSRGLQPVRELGIYNKAQPRSKAAAGGKADSAAPGTDGEESGYESTGERRVRFDKDGNKKVGAARGGGAAGSGRTTPVGGRNGNNKKNAPASGARVSGGGGRYSSARGGDDNATSGDNFNRSRAHVANPNLKLGELNRVNQPADSGADRIDVVRNFGGAGPVDPTRTTLGETGPRPVLQCANCKVLLNSQAPRFCRVTGEAHM